MSAVILATSAASCGTTNKSSYAKALPDLGGLEPKSGFSFLCDWNIPSGHQIVGTKSSAGILIDVDEKCFLSSLSTIVAYSGEPSSLTLKIYRWAGDYTKTVKRKPVYTASADIYSPGQKIIAHIEPGAVSGGTFLCRFTNATGCDVGFETAYAPEEKAEGVSFVKCYNGNKEISDAYRTYVTYYDYSEGVIPEQTAKTVINPDKAHVILILGQSNATGQAMTSLLQKNISEEQFARYSQGFENVKMYYNVDGGINFSTDFVNVSINQGGTKERFGPELGIADVLTERFPGETFYIIKASWSGAGLTKHFQEGCGEYTVSISNIAAGLKKLTKAGLDPEIFAIVWMQGETDSWYYDDTLAYAERQEDYIKRVSASFSKYIAENGVGFVDCAISDTYAWTLSGIINAQKEICDSKNVNYFFYETSHLGCMKENDDIAHYDSLDMIEIGRLFGDGISKIYVK